MKARTVEVRLQSFLTLAVDVDEWSASSQGRVHPDKSRGEH